LMENIMRKMYEVADLAFRPKTKQEAYSKIKEQTYLFLKSALEEKEMMQVITEAIGISETVQGKWGDIRSRFITGIMKDIEYVQLIGLAKKKVDAALIAKGWFYMNEQIMWDLVLNEISDDIQDIAETITDLYMGGLYE